MDLGDELRGLNLGHLVGRPSTLSFLKEIEEQVEARVAAYTPMTVEDRLRVFRTIGFRPHGLYLPTDPTMLGQLRARVRDLGDIAAPDARFAAYASLQDETAALEAAGVPGRWNGQQAVARSPATFRVVVLGRRGGKALALETPIPTPFGWTTMGEIEQGDVVYDETGHPCRVTSATDVMEGHDCFRVHFSDGQVIVADADHQWQVETKRVRKNGKLAYNPKYPDYRIPDTPQVVLTTREMYANQKTGSGESQYSIPCAAPLVCQERDLSVDPYLLGVWLGDGTSYNGSITTADPEILDELRARGTPIGPAFGTNSGRAQQYRLTTGRRGGTLQQRAASVEGRLRGLGLLRNKHIPTQYLRASAAQRLDLLQGLMDTDGYVDAGGRCEFTTTRQVLAEGVLELLGSLGQQAQIRTGRVTLNGRYIGLKYRILFRPTIAVFKLPRKLERQQIGPGWFRTRRYIRKIEPCESVPVRCISVDSPSHLYLAAGFVPTHNTFEASREAYAVLTSRVRSTVWVVAPTMRLVGRVFDMLVQLVKDLKIAVDTLRNGRDEKLLILANGSRAEGVSVDNVLSAAGAAVDFAIVDEAAQISYEAFSRAILPPLTDRNGQALFISSWEGEDTFFAQQADLAKQLAEEGEDWAFFEDASWDVNFYSFPQGRRTPALQRQEALMDPADFLEQYGAVRAGARHLIYPQFKREVHCGDYPFDPNHPVVLAADPSSGANEYAVIALQDYGDRVHVIDEIYIPGVVAEDVFPLIWKKPWYQNISEGVMDSASPAEIERWVRAGFNMIGVPDKPQPEESFPIYRNLLRDPSRYHQFYLRMVQDVLLDWGVDPEEYLGLDRHLERRIQIEIEERLSRPSPQDIAILRDCAHIFFNEATTTFTAEEHRHYIYRRPTRANLSMLEKPRKWRDHALDALRYFSWTYKRWDWEVPGTDYNIVLAGGADDLIRTRPPEPEEDPRAFGMRGFLQQMRDDAAKDMGWGPSRSFIPSWTGD